MAEILSEFGHLVGLTGGNNIQATTMPTYSSVPLGTIVQYIGTTTADYINGYFYKATATGWEQHDTQPASNADNSITAFKESSPALAAHAVDDYIRYNNVTYIVTAAIAIGDTLTVGTNIAVPTLDEGTVIYTPETGGGINGVVDVLVDGQSVVDENGEAHINTPNAGGIGYDNTASELEATNTQDAIDEVVDIVADKVDKVSSATNGNLAGLDASGNLVDSGIASSIFPSGTSSSDKLVKASENNFKYEDFGSNARPDFDTLTTQGLYSVYAGSAGVANQHSPAASTWFSVYVSRVNNNPDYVQQLALNSNGYNYIRTCYNGTWSAWDSLVKQTDLNGIIKRNDFITSTDLNTLLYSGIYPLGQYNTHTPNDGDYNFTYCTLYVSGNGSGGVASQIMIDRTNNIYRRRFLSGTWSAWNREADYDEIAFITKGTRSGNVDQYRISGPFFFDYSENTGSNYYLHFRPTGGYMDCAFTVYMRGNMVHCTYTVNSQGKISSIVSVLMDGTSYSNAWYINTNANVATFNLYAWGTFMIIGRIGGAYINVDTTADPES